MSFTCASRRVATNIMSLFSKPALRIEPWFTMTYSPLKRRTPALAYPDVAEHVNNKWSETSLNSEGRHNLWFPSLDVYPSIEPAGADRIEWWSLWILFTFAACNITWSHSFAHTHRFFSFPCYPTGKQVSFHLQTMKQVYRHAMSAAKKLVYVDFFRKRQEG